MQSVADGRSSTRTRILFVSNLQSYVGWWCCERQESRVVKSTDEIDLGSCRVPIIYSPYTLTILSTHLKGEYLLNYKWKEL